MPHSSNTLRRWLLVVAFTEKTTSSLNEQGCRINEVIEEQNHEGKKHGDRHWKLRFVAEEWWDRQSCNNSISVAPHQLKVLYNAVLVHTLYYMLYGGPSFNNWPMSMANRRMKTCSGKGTIWRSEKDWGKIEWLKPVQGPSATHGRNQNQQGLEAWKACSRRGQMGLGAANWDRLGFWFTCWTNEDHSFGECNSLRCGVRLTFLLSFACSQAPVQQFLLVGETVCHIGPWMH